MWLNIHGSMSFNIQYLICNDCDCYCPNYSFSFFKLVFLLSFEYFSFRMEKENPIKAVKSQSNSTTSSNSELDKDLVELDLNGSTTNGDEENGGTSSNGSLILSTSTLKKRISSSRTPTRKAKRVRFFRNGDRFYGGIVIPVSTERYR